MFGKTVVWFGLVFYIIFVCYYCVEDSALQFADNAVGHKCTLGDKWRKEHYVKRKSIWEFEEFGSCPHVVNCNGASSANMLPMFVNY